MQKTSDCVPNFWISLCLGAVRCNWAHQVTVNWQQSVCRRSGAHRSCTNGGVFREVRVNGLLIKYHESKFSLLLLVKGKVCIWAKWPIRLGCILVSVAWRDQECFYSPLDGMLIHCRVTPSIRFASTHLYTWVERDTNNTTQCPWPGHKPRPLDTEMSTPTKRPPHLPQFAIHEKLYLHPVFLWCVCEKRAKSSN